MVIDVQINFRQYYESFGAGFTSYVYAKTSLYEVEISFKFDYNPYNEDGLKPYYFNKFAGFFYGISVPVYLTNCISKPKIFDMFTTKP